MSAVADSRDPNDVVAGFNNIYNYARNNPSYKSCNNLAVNEALFITLKNDTHVTKNPIVYIFVKGTRNPKKIC